MESFQDSFGAAEGKGRIPVFGLVQQSRVMRWPVGVGRASELI